MIELHVQKRVSDDISETMLAGTAIALSAVEDDDDTGNVERFSALATVLAQKVNVNSDMS